MCARKIMLLHMVCDTIDLYKCAKQLNDDARLANSWVSLSLSGGVSAAQKVLKLLASCENVLSLSLDDFAGNYRAHTPLRYTDNATLIKIAEAMPRITALHLGNCTTISGKTLARCCKAHWENLRHVSIEHGVGMLDHESYRILAEQWTQLERLDILGFPYNHDDATWLLTMQTIHQYCGNLKMLYIDAAIPHRMRDTLFELFGDILILRSEVHYEPSMWWHGSS